MTPKKLSGIGLKFVADHTTNTILYGITRSTIIERKVNPWTYFWMKRYIKRQFFKAMTNGLSFWEKVKFRWYMSLRIIDLQIFKQRKK